MYQPTEDEWTTVIFCQQWQSHLDFDPNPIRRRVSWSEDNNSVNIERHDGKVRHHYHMLTLSSAIRLMTLCEKYSWKWEFASDDRYMFNRKLQNDSGKE